MAHHLSPEVGADELRVAREVFPQFDTQPRDGVLSLDEFAAAFPVSAASGSNDLKQAHLSFGGPGAMWIMWVTDANASAPFVRWGLSSSALSNTSNGTSHTYNVGLLGWHKWIHQARMAPLAPDTVYYYQYGHVGSTVGPVYSFKMPSPSVARLAFHGDQVGCCACRVLCIVADCMCRALSSPRATPWLGSLPRTAPDTAATPCMWWAILRMRGRRSRRARRRSGFGTCTRASSKCTPRTCRT